MIEIVPAVMIVVIVIAIINGIRDTEDNTAGWS
jgi:hypothetical protein